MPASECWNRGVQQGAEEFYGYGVKASELCQQQLNLTTLVNNIGWD